MASNPSIRNLIRRSVVAQVLIGLLLVIVVVLMLVRTLRLVDDQERDTRAIGEMRAATEALLGTVDGIDSYARTGEPQARRQYEASLADLRRRFETAAERLDGLAAQRAMATAKVVDEWNRQVLRKAAVAADHGDLDAARDVVIGRRNDAMIGVIGLAIADLLNGQVVKQLETDRQSRRYAIAAASASLLALLLLVGSSWFLLLRIRRYVVPPLEQLDAAAARIGEGDFAARVEPTGASETASAGRSFNEMAERIERNIEELRELDTLKDEFVAAVSHELRTPITTIRAYVDMHLGGEAGELSSGQRAGMEVISRSAAELSDLIDDLLTLTNIEAGRERVIHAEAIRAADLVNDLERELRPTFESAGIVLTVDVDDGLKVKADPLRIRQVMVNLLSNARKFSGSGSTVRVTVTPQGEHAKFTVADTGIGIAADDLPHIGERFYRAKEVLEVPGTGLGVAIVRELVELHGGELTIDSTLGRGTTVTFTLPRA